MSSDTEKQPPTAAEYEAMIRHLQRAHRQVKRDLEATVDNHHEIVERLEATHRSVVDGLRAEIVRLKDDERFTGDAFDLEEVRRQIAEDVDIGTDALPAALKRARAKAAETIDTLIRERDADRDAGWRDFNALTYILGGNEPTEEMVAAGRYGKAIEVRTVFDAVWALVDASDAPKASMASQCLAALDNLKADRASLAEARPKLARLERFETDIRAALDLADKPKVSHRTIVSQVSALAAYERRSPMEHRLLERLQDAIGSAIDEAGMVRHVSDMADAATKLREYLYEPEEYATATPAAIVGRVISRVSEAGMLQRNLDGFIAGLRRALNHDPDTAYSMIVAEIEKLKREHTEIGAAADLRGKIARRLGYSDDDILPTMEALLAEVERNTRGKAEGAPVDGEAREDMRRLRADIDGFEARVQRLQKALAFDEDGLMTFDDLIVAAERLKREHTEMASAAAAGPPRVINMTKRLLWVHFDGHAWRVHDGDGRGGILTAPDSTAKTISGEPPKSVDVKVVAEAPGKIADSFFRFHVDAGDCTAETNQKPTFDPGSMAPGTVVKVKDTATGETDFYLAPSEKPGSMAGAVAHARALVAATGRMEDDTCDKEHKAAFGALRRSLALLADGLDALKRRDDGLDIHADFTHRGALLAALGFTKASDDDIDPLEVIRRARRALDKAGAGHDQPLDEAAADVAEVIDAEIAEERPTIEVHIGSVNLVDSGGALKALGSLGLRLNG